MAEDLDLDEGLDDVARLAVAGVGEVLAGYQPQTEDSHSGLEERNCISSSETGAPPPNGNKSFLFRKRQRIELSVCWLKYVCLGEKILEEFDK